MYPKRYELLDKNNVVLGIGVRWAKYQRIKWSLPMLEGARWISAGKRVRHLTKRALDVCPSTADGLHLWRRDSNGKYCFACGKRQ